MQLHGHNFVNFKSTEKICWTCGFVIEREMTKAEVEKLMIECVGFVAACGGAWHRYVPVNAAGNV